MDKQLLYLLDSVLSSHGLDHSVCAPSPPRNQYLDPDHPFEIEPAPMLTPFALELRRVLRQLSNQAPIPDPPLDALYFNRGGVLSAESRPGQIPKPVPLDQTHSLRDF
jgi:hypothetical protein